MKLDKIPVNIKFGDIFYMKNCNSHIVYVGKINEDNANVYEKFTRKISRNNPSFLRENLDTHSYIFITFDNGLYYYQLNDDFEQCYGGIKEVLPNYNKPIPEDLSKILDEMKQLLGVKEMKQYQIFIDKDGNEWLHLGSDGMDNLKIDLFSVFQYQGVNFNKFKDNTGHHRVKFNEIAVNKKREWDNFDMNFNNGRENVQLTPTKRFTTSVSEWLNQEGNGKMSSEKIFICHKGTKKIRCASGGKFVKYADEIDDFERLGKEITAPNEWSQINIDYPTYLILTGLKEKSKETELAEIKAKILSSETLGCQKDVMAPLVEDLLSLVHKVNNLKHYKREVVATVSYAFSSIVAGNSEVVGRDVHKYEVTRELLANYVRKLQEK